MTPEPACECEELRARVIKAERELAELRQKIGAAIEGAAAKIIEEFTALKF